MKKNVITLVVLFSMYICVTINEKLNALSTFKQWYFIGGSCGYEGIKHCRENTSTQPSLVDNGVFFKAL